ncbi:MAG: chemotaxis protein CheW, partial [Proteobacteria bacterium]|nr:chemotaxis protein CheW [Pseudomonadota bacterium]
DVVKRNIELLKGTVEVESRKGSGTRITLKLPLTLAIIDGLLVTIGGDHYIIPLAAIEECVELRREDLDRAHGRQTVTVRNELVPYVRLRERFGINGGRPAIEQVVIGQINDQRMGFVVDRVIGDHQTVIKSLGPYYRQVTDISGATIMGDGSVALILDMPNIVQGAEAAVR